MDLLKNAWIKIGQHLLITICLCIPMIYNGAPLYYPDSMGYIFWGMMGKVPPERVGVYGFYSVFLGKVGLWIPVLVQSAIMTWLIRVVIQKVAKINSFGFELLIGSLLGLLTSLGFTASMLMPDLFCAISSFALVLFLWVQSAFSKNEQWVIVFLIWFGSLFHASVFLVNFMVASISLFVFLFKKAENVPWKNLAFAYMLVVLGYISIGLVQYPFEKRFIISKASNAFIFGRFAETGILSKYLENECNNGANPLCAIKDKLPIRTEFFLWNPNSFINQFGGLEDKQGIYGATVKEVLLTPYLAFNFMISGSKSGAKQFLLTEVGDGLSPSAKPQLRFFPSDLADYLNSKQVSGIPFQLFQTAHYLLLAALVLVFIFKIDHTSDRVELNTLAWGILILLISNAFVNGAFSTPLHRYQAKVFWLVGFWLMLYLGPFFRKSSA